MVKRRVFHQQIFKPNPFGGVTNTTICGRVDNSEADLNVEGEAVTCKFCLKIITEGKSPRLKWIGWNPSE